MYCRHFNLEKKPFQISSDNAFLWLGSNHAAALSSLKKGIEGPQGLMVLTGDVGTGKTTLINEIIHTLPPHIDCIKIPDPCLEMHFFFLGIALEFGFTPDYKNKANFSSSFFSFLKSEKNQGKKKLIIVDEAQRIPKRILKELIAWSIHGANHGADPILTILLAGQLEFHDLLENTLGKDWQSRIPLRAELMPLDEKETKTYINKRLELAGGNRNIFLMTTVQAIHQYTKGIPRLINIACDQTLITAFAKDIRIVDVNTFKEATGQLDLPKQHLKIEQVVGTDRDAQDSGTAKKTIAALAAVFTCLFFGYFFLTGKTIEAPMPEPYSPPEKSPEKLYPLPTVKKNLEKDSTIYPVPENSSKGLPPLLFSSAVHPSPEKRTMEEGITDTQVFPGQDIEKALPKKPADPGDDAAVGLTANDVFDLEKGKYIHGRNSPLVEIADAGQPDQGHALKPTLSPQEPSSHETASQETDPGAIIDWIIKKKRLQ